MLYNAAAVNRSRGMGVLPGGAPPGPVSSRCLPACMRVSGSSQTACEKDQQLRPRQTKRVLLGSISQSHKQVKVF